MARVNEFKSFFEKTVSGFLAQDGRSEQEKLIFYLKLYDHLVSAQHLMKKNSYARSFDYIRIVQALASSTSFPRENVYINYINSLAREIFSHRKEVARVINKNESEDAYHVITKMLMAQNVCLLRILKISKGA